MSRVRGMFAAAMDAHREAVAQLRAARTALATARSADGPEVLAELAEQARAAAGRLATGWLSADWDTAADLPVGRDVPADASAPVRVGTAVPAGPDSLTYPAIVPLLGTGHLALAGDAGTGPLSGDTGTGPLAGDTGTGTLAGVLLRLLAAAPAGLVRVCWVGGGLPAAFAPLRAAGLLVEADPDAAFAAADRQREQAVRAGQDRAALPYLVLVGAVPMDLARLRVLAEQGPAARVHLLLAGQPAPLPHTTGLLAATPEGSSATPGAPARVRYAAGVEIAVRPDPAPSDQLVAAVCGRLAGSLRPRFALLVPPSRWAERPGAGLATPIGLGATGPAHLVFSTSRPHWLVTAGTARAAGAVALTAVYGLAARYSPDDLALHLVDATGLGLFAEFAPAAGDPGWLPHARTVGDGERLAPVLAALSAEVAERESGGSTDDDARPRILLVVAGAVPGGAVVERGAAVGVHLLVCAGEPAVPAQRGGRFARITVSDVDGTARLDGSTVRLIDPFGAPAQRARLRQALWQARTPGSAPPAVSGTTSLAGE